MDNAEQASRGPSKGIFDTASLLGLSSPHITPCKTAAPSSADIQSSPFLHSTVSESPDKETTVLSTNEKPKPVSNSLQNSLSLTASLNSITKLSSKRSADSSNELNSEANVLSPKKSSVKKKKKSQKKIESKNSRKANGSTHSKKSDKKPKEDSAKRLSSDSESHADSSSNSTSESGTSGGSSSGSSDSSDDEEREKQQKKLARLKKQQKELRRKVQELKQAHESHQKVDAHIKKTPPKAVVSNTSLNHSNKPSPSPAHSATTTIAVSPKTLSPKKLNFCTEEEDPNMSGPLDLCVKKQETVFEVTSSAIHNTYTPTICSVKKPLHLPANPAHQITFKPIQAGPKKRGRKPKSISITPNVLPPDLIHQSKQNALKELRNMLPPHKILLTPADTTKNTSIPAQKKDINCASQLKILPSLPASTSSAFPAPRKNFTLDSLLGDRTLLSESNGTVDIPTLIQNNMDITSGSSLNNKTSKNKEKLKYGNRVKKVDDKMHEYDSISRAGSCSPSDSEQDNDNSESEDSEHSALGSVSTSVHGHKRSYDEDGEDSPHKRRRVLPDERELQIPLEHGWRRQTKIRCFSRSGVRGEVIYYTPCGKKLRNYPEVVRYLIRNGITDISRDNFTFSTKVNVGEFLECTSSGSGEDYVLLNEQEVVARINEVRARKGRLGVQHRKSSHQRSVEEEELQRQWEQKQFQHQLEQQELSRQAREMKMMKQLEREQALMAAKDEKKITAEESRRQKEQQRLMKQQERYERLEQLRIEREIRAQQLLEEQEMKRQQAVFMREQERERRRQHMILVRALETRKKQEERERKREEMLYEKRINKEKKMEQRRMELDYLRELKKPVEDMMLKDTADLPVFKRIPGMKLSGQAFADVLMVFEFLHNFGETLGFDAESLPSLNSMQMALLNLDEKCEDELLSIIHHLLVCAIEDPGVPHYPEAATVLGQNLKDADITNNNVSEVLRLYFIAQDRRNKMCQWLQAKPFLSLNATQKAEILAHVCNDLLSSRVLIRQIDNNIENVNVLRKDKWIIEGDLRRLKTAQQRRLLKARQISYEETKLEQMQNGSTTSADISDICPSNNESKDTTVNSNIDDSIKETSQNEKDKLNDVENDGNESGNESDETQAPASDAEDEDLNLSNEELNKKVEKLTKQLTLYSNKLTRALHTIRAITFGQDRYHRRYWVLPKSGGVYVESMESAELDEQRLLILSASAEAEPETENKESEIKPENDTVCDSVKKEPENSADKTETENLPAYISHVGTGNEIRDAVQEVSEHKVEKNMFIKNEQIVTDTSDTESAVFVKDVTKEATNKQEQNNEITLSETKKEHESNSADKNSEKKEEKKSDVNIFMPKFCDNSIGLNLGSSLNHTLHNSADRKHVPNPSVPNDQNWLFHSPFFASLLAGNMLFNGPMMPGRDANGTYFNLPKNDSNNPFGPFLGLQSGMFSAEHIFKSLNEKPSSQKPWFSILPRMPCDETSLNSSQLPKPTNELPSFHSPVNLLASSCQSSSKMASQPSHTTPVSAAAGHNTNALSNFQMEMMNGLPPNFFMHPFLSHQFGPTYQNSLPVSSTSNQTTFTSSLSTSSPLTDFNLNLGRPPAASTPSSIPTPSATPGLNSQGSATPTFRDSPSPSFTKRLMMEKMTQEYEKPKPIPQNVQRGWWKITEASKVKDLVNALHHRGIREKMLQKQLQKHFNYACASCSQGQNEATDLSVTDADKEISELPGGAPAADNIEEWSRDVALRVDLSILEQVENLEEKVDGASMQVKGWKPPAKLSVESHNKFVPACELYLKMKCSDEIVDVAKEKSPRKSGKKNSRKKKSESKKKIVEPEPVEPVPELKVDEPGLTKDSEATDLSQEEKGDQIDDKEKISEVPEILEKEILDVPPPLSPGKFNPVEEAKKRLLLVEAAIERRYLKPPLGFSTNEINRSALSSCQSTSNNSNNNNNNNNSNNSSVLEAPEEEIIPAGLQKWRNAVQACRSSSQLAMCLNYLETFTAWDKSIMRASCQFCHSGDNEEKLLLCDGCDKGYHTYCFKPKMETIPDGDWYCYECLNKATGDNVCVICGKKGKLIECDSCPKCFHLSCLEPPLSKMPKGKWYCSGCSLNRPKKSSKKSNSSSNNSNSNSNNNNNKDKEGAKETKEAASNKKSESNQSSKPKSGGEKKEKKEKVQPQPNKDLVPCSAIVSEMEKHDDAWPFLAPVNTKQFPTYRKVIKKPMDLATVHNRLESGQYKNREDFAADVRLIFDNCETFNEDDSPVGQAGHTMRAFFETRWAELCNT